LDPPLECDPELRLTDDFPEDLLLREEVRPDDELPDRVDG